MVRLIQPMLLSGVCVFGLDCSNSEFVESRDKMFMSSIAMRLEPLVKGRQIDLIKTPKIFVETESYLSPL